ncbi:hypothetical protein BHYA_0279g00080 [Botrytis hyacinthi]|uniref:Uncharacterized protein n=1 Tax=Botrytis hyacinthi TaxID=278943 RepID=A0A4Z1G7L1_9HELO|nr:hypothetical protein BHYA_0279g00080 [Botrytis hyacinthi]
MERKTDRHSKSDPINVSTRYETTLSAKTLSILIAKNYCKPIGQWTNGPLQRQVEDRYYTLPGVLAKTRRVHERRKSQNTVTTQVAVKQLQNQYKRGRHGTAAAATHYGGQVSSVKFDCFAALAEQNWIMEVGNFPALIDEYIFWKHK